MESTFYITVFGSPRLILRNPISLENNWPLEGLTDDCLLSETQLNFTSVEIAHTWSAMDGNRPRPKNQGPEGLASDPKQCYKLSEAMLHELIVFPPLSNTAE